MRAIAPKPIPPYRRTRHSSCGITGAVTTEMMISKAIHPTVATRASHIVIPLDGDLFSARRFKSRVAATAVSGYPSLILRRGSDHHVSADEGSVDSPPIS